MYAAIDSTCRPRRARGLSLIEVMVGLVVGLLVSLAAASSAQLFTASQRQSIGTGSSSASAATTLASIKNDVVNAGLGFFGDSSYLCAGLQLSAGARVVADAGDFAPIKVVGEQSGDRLEVVHGSEVAAGASVALSAWSAEGDGATLLTLLPVEAGQAVLVAPRTAGRSCLVRTVTAMTPPGAEAMQSLVFGRSGWHNQAAFSQAPGPGDDARVALLGRLQWNRYTLKGTDLVLTRVLDDAQSVLMRHVIAFRVQYGVSAAEAGSTTLDSWEDADGAFSSISEANITRLRALRIGVVVRSPQREKPNARGQCEASSEKPTLFGAAVEPDVADWQCFRYRNATVVAPMRNLIYGLKAS